MKLSSIIPLLTLSAASAVSAFQASANTNVALYWGQNSAGGMNTQARLSEYCESDASDIVLLSFLNIFFGTGGKPEVNFASACNDGTLFSGTALLQCPNIADDIKVCQSKGKKVILSLGGASGAYGFSSDSQAEEFAQTLWDLFAGGDSDTRPFGDSIIDGFDLDIEGGSSVGYVALSKKLRELYNTDSSRNYYITAAPQCPIPDYFVNGVITQSEIDFVFVQFYNNYCGMQAWAAGNANSNFNFEAWDALIKSSPNPNGKIYLGVPASLSAAGSGYVGIDTVVEAANYLQSNYKTFGGIMMWDASQAWANVNDGKNFAEGAKAGLLGSSSSNSGSGDDDTSANQGTSSSIQSTVSSSIAISQSQITTLSSAVKSSSAAASSSATPSSSAAALSSAAASSSAIVSSSVLSAEPTTTTFVTNFVDVTSTLSGTLTITTSIPESSSSNAEVEISTVESSSTFGSSTETESPSSTLAPTTSEQLEQSSSSLFSSSPASSSAAAETTAESQSSEVVVTVIKSSAPNQDTSSAVETITSSPIITSAPASVDNNDGDDVITEVVTQKRSPSTLSVFTTKNNVVTQELPGPSPTGNYEVIGQSAYSSLDTNGALIYNLETAPPQLDRRRANRYSGHQHAPHQKRANVVVSTSSKASSKATINTCPVSGGACKTDGELKCVSHGYARCTNGQWVVRSCSSGTVCKESGSDIFCDWAGSWVLSPSSCGGYVEKNTVSKRSLSEDDDSIFGGGVFVAKTPDNKALTDEMYSLKISIQQLNSTHFKGMLTTSTITNNPVGKTWKLSFISSLNITSVERGDLSYDAKSHTYTVDSIRIEEPKSNMAVLIPFWGLV